MPRALDFAGLTSILAEHTSTVWSVCITIDHADLAVPFRFTDNTESIVRSAGTYTFFPFSVSMPQQSPEGQKPVTLSISAVDQAIVAALRSVEDEPTVTLELVLATAPDPPQQIYADLLWKIATYDVLTVEGELLPPETLSVRFPGDDFTATSFPALG